MCLESEKIIFCTCEAENEDSKFVESFNWSLERFLRSKESRIKGKILAPSSDLGSEINLERIIEEMNSRNCFDFDYSPQEKDSFKLNNGLERTDYKYFSLIYINGKWEEGMNPVLGRSVLKNISKGRMKIDKT